MGKVFGRLTGPGLAGILLGGTLLLAQAPTPAGPPAAQVTSPAQDQPQQPASPAQAPAPALKTGRILGRVTDAGKPVQGAQVRLNSRTESGLLRITSTNERGEYRFKDLPSGTYDVEVEADGFRLSSKPGVEVKAPFQNIVDVQMARVGAPPASGFPALPRHPGAPGQGELVPPAAPAEPALPPVTVQGVLLDGDRRPVVDVSVLLVPLQGTRLYQATSKNDGAFIVTDVVPGRYRTVIRSPGHMPVDLKSVEVRPDAGLTLNLSLVDFPLNFKERAEGSPPPEMPKALPGMLPPAQPGAPLPPPQAAPPAAPPATTTEPIEKAPPSSPPAQANPPSKGGNPPAPAGS
jgi:hypothetical protein